ncbi:60S ribosomal protein L38, putative [Plasmodium knowlesi strain H]|uniref:60S ribosomal protein L38, putative n=3 Tax=Plasmodium knowlesi TaxID=5850 RepID=A0A5K1V137_PLAKH|nr:60S ribosomal protein L38, putative [Plasmodium knowlesi strain H]OTN65090.1 putative 60S ribosomal protein L38 [Plasmodium knowlesi]CAA9988327.1 60S ribosomal protein L38, putative [Plasmodium knowlesi strain H]SBO20166.1 60S ribosomal protein L38, putative [Plasmodium knowlesi strain H]SBO20278.1 60S ribosomal protein L38, putative [Plasmodium knowlesi strain H]VVS77801.1 60S ribosomal protein L38, putative [Plasmodium knowlesi strain H]|eukprot:XP_002259306.1 ribosomal protein l38e, putative [Plasmodium knowlesi strain H]
MPKQITDIRKFLKISRKPDTTAVIIMKKKSKTKKNTIITKLKLRTKKYLYTMVFSDRKKAERIENSLLPSLKRIYFPQKKVVQPVKKTKFSKG